MTGHDESTLSRRTVLRTAGAAGTASLAGCVDGRLPDALDGGGSGGDGADSIRVGQVLPPVTLDPLVITSESSAHVASKVFEGLYEYGEGAQLRPALAAGEPTVSDDATRYEIELSEDARFQNGDRVTARDVKYSFEAPARDGAPTAWATSMIDRVEVVDDRTARFHLAYPYQAFGHVLTRGVVPQSEREANPERFARKRPVGSGPFRVELFGPGDRAVLTRWDDYWREPTPAVERAEFVPVESDLARTTSLRTGQNDLVERVPAKLWDVVETMPTASIATAQSYRTHLVGFNCNEGPTTDRRVRAAIAHCFDMDEAVRSFVEPAGSPQHSPIPDRIAEAWGLPLDRWKNRPRGTDVAKARTLFERADVGSWAPKIAVPKGDKLRETIGETIAHGLGEAGFRRARVVKYRPSTFRSKTVSGVPGEYHVFVRSWTGTPDPDSFLYPLFHENAAGATNGTFYAKESVMNDILAARRSSDRAERRRRYASAIDGLLEDWVCLPAYTLHNSYGVADRVSGFRPSPFAEINPRLVYGPDVVELDG